MKLASSLSPCLLAAPDLSILLFLQFTGKES